MTVATVFLGMQIERCSNRRLLFFFCGIIESRSVTIDQSLVRSIKRSRMNLWRRMFGAKMGLHRFPAARKLRCSNSALESRVQLPKNRVARHKSVGVGIILFFFSLSIF